MTNLDRNHNVFVTATVGKTRIKTPYSLEEVIESNKTRAYPMNPPKAHTEIALNNPVVRPTGPNGTFTPEEEFINSKISATKKDGTPHPNGPQLWLQNKLDNPLPSVGVIKVQPDGSQAIEPLELQGELAQGVRVMVIARAFNSPKGDGKSFDAVVVASPEDVRYYGAQVNSAFEAMGFAVKGDLSQRPATPVAPVAPSAPAAPSAPVVTPPTPQLGDFSAQGQAQPQMPAAPQVAPQMQSAPSAPQMPQMPANNDLPAHQQGSPFPASPVNDASTPASPFAQNEAPAASNTDQPAASGINYNPNNGAFPTEWNV